MYNKHTFEDHKTVLTKKILDEMEAGIEAAQKSDATPESAGVVRQCPAVAPAAGETVTQTEFNALLTAMKTAGIMANE